MKYNLIKIIFFNDRSDNHFYIVVVIKNKSLYKLLYADQKGRAILFKYIEKEDISDVRNELCEIIIKHEMKLSETSMSPFS